MVDNYKSQEQDQDPIPSSMQGKVGPFGHSERVPRPNTLIQEGLSSSSSNSESSSSNKLEMPTLNGEFLSKVYEASHLYILYLFIILHLVIYFFLAFYLKKNGTDNIDLLLKRIFDYTLLFIIIAYLLYYYAKAPAYDQQNVIPVFWNWCIDWMKDPINLYGMVFFTIAFYIWVFFLHINTRAEYTPFFIYLLEEKLWIIIVFFVLFFALQYFFQVDIYGFFFGNQLVAGIFNKFSDDKLNEKGLIVIKDKNGNTIVKDNTEVTGNTTVNGNTEVKAETINYDEVFNIGNNLYSYEDAKEVCSAYDSRLATYDEVEDAYNHGAEWCNYGWSDGQMAFFPTQKSTWDQLQKNPKDKNKCGRPGVNGGYMDNKFLRFGVNCFGKKPPPKPEDLAKMNQPLPQTAEQAIINKKVEFWKNNKDALLKVNSFNKTKWTEY